MTEGTAAVFTLTADRAPAADLTVNLTVSESSVSDYVAAGDEGSKTVTITFANTGARPTRWQYGADRPTAPTSRTAR